jgi:glycosyltransferase involved in cell wall biosynthesis
MLVGHPYGVQAVGEYLRESAAALAAAGVPFGIRNALDWGEHLRGTHPGFTSWDRLTTANPYRVNLLHVNANEMADVRRHLGAAFFAGRGTIACWHWELARFPAAWRPALKGVDELWASSRFMQRALREATRAPVLWMPHPVHLDPAPPLSRADLGLPQDAFLFLTSFDLNSYVARKNPQGALRAFQIAFPAGSADPVAFVVKVSGSTERADEARALFASSLFADPRVVVIDELLDRPRMVGLMAQCDAFVSLHRTEGFGRGLAEAMLLGKTVIATGYSGNVDFTTPRTACVVDYRLIPVEPGEYLHSEGQVWADPDLDQAAGYMQRIVRDRAWAEALATAGRELVHTQHGLAAVGGRYRARLVELGFV